MNYNIPAIVTCLIISTSACTNSASSKVEAPDTTRNNNGNAPVETQAANATYKPAFEGQTRIAAVTTTTPYQSTVLTTGLKSPWGIAILPDGKLLITEKGGTMRIVTVEGSIGQSITGIPAVNSNGQGGLLGITLDPDFTSNRMVYWTFSENRPGGTLTAVAKGRLADNEKSIENSAVIYRATPAYNGTLHYGGRILFNKEGNLFVSTGERSDLETRPQAQDLNSGLGKVMYITKEGQPAAGNPFVGAANARPEIYTYGHRNVQSLAIHPETGELWEGEFGPRGGDEINRLQPGKNYGWPVITYGIEYAGGKVGQGITQKEGMEQPVYYWDPVLSPSGMTFYSGDMIPEWKNNLFISGLSSTHIARLVISNNKVTGEERLLADEKQRFRALVQGKDGALYAATDGGRLYRITKK